MNTAQDFFQSCHRHGMKENPSSKLNVHSAMESSTSDIGRINDMMSEHHRSVVLVRV